MFLKTYLGIFVFFLLCIGLSSIILMLSFFVTEVADDAEKLTAYECGFNPFIDSRAEFDIKFYLIAILFIIFDLELSFLFPFSLCFGHVQSDGVFSMCFFLSVLILGFIYEWKKGALEWNR